MLPSTAEVAFGGVIIYQRQRQLSLVQLLNTPMEADKKLPVLFVGQQSPRKVLEGGDGGVVPVRAQQPLSF